MTRLFRGTKTRRVLIIMTVLVMIISYVQFPTVASASDEPSIGTAVNVADSMTVSNTGKDVTAQYRSSKAVAVQHGESGQFGNLEFGKSNSYTMSATVTYDSYSANYASIGLIFATGKDSNGASKNAEVYFRAFQGTGVGILNLSAGGEKYHTVVGKELGATTTPAEYTYTVSYNNGNVSFWVNGTQIFSDVDISKATKDFPNNKLTDSSPKLGFTVRECTGTISNVKIWGDVEPITEPIIGTAMNFAEDADLIVLNSGRNDTLSYRRTKTIAVKATEQRRSGTFGEFEFGDSYVISADIEIEPHTDEMASDACIGLIIAMGQNAKKETKDIAVYIRPYQDGGKGVQLLDLAGSSEVFHSVVSKGVGANTAKDNVYKFTVAYKNGKISAWINSTLILYNTDVTQKGTEKASNVATNVSPKLGFLANKCNSKISNVKIWGDLELNPTEQVPEKPQSNANYADYMGISSGTVITYSNGVLTCTKDEQPISTTFQYLPFDADDTYVYGFDLNIKKADKSFHSPRITIGKTKEGKAIRVFFLKNTISIFEGDKEIKAIPYDRELNKLFRVDMLIEPKAMTLWIDGVLIIDELELSEKSEATTGVLFENVIAEMSNIDLYYTNVVKFEAPEVPEKPVYKELGSNQYNAAEWMSVSLGTKAYEGYFGNKLINNDSSAGFTYLFSNMPVTDDMSYYYGATYKVTESSANWKGPRFIFRYNGDGTKMLVAITQNDVIVLADGKTVASAPFKMQVGKSYDIVMYSTPKTVTVWIDGQLIMESVNLTPYIKDKLTAKMGVLFELCKAEITNLAIYGKDIVFDPAYVDEELYASKEYRMAGIPTMPTNGINLFQNIKMINWSGDTVGAKFDKEAYVLTTEYAVGEGDIEFVDAKGSSNLNGLKNESGYVFSFTYKVDESESKYARDSAFWVTTNKSGGPFTTKDNHIRVGFSKDAVMLEMREESALKTQQIVTFTREYGREYDVAIVHGRNWIKVYVDNVLTLVSTNLPTYDIDFSLWIRNVKMEIDNFKLYEFESSGLTILEADEVAEKVSAGHNLKNATEYVSHGARVLPVMLLTISGTAVLVGIAGVALCVIHLVKYRKNKSQIGGKVSCEKEL